MTKGREVIYELTDRGREYLQTLELPTLRQSPSRSQPKPIQEAVRKYVEPYLLFQILDAEGQTLSKSEANKKLNALGKKYLGLNAASADQVRQRMIATGLIESVGESKNAGYRLTPTGLAYLAEHEQYPAYKYTLRGDVLNCLLKTANGATTQQPSRSAAAAYAPRPADLSQAAYAEFEELLRERYGHTGLVPIHEIRERMASKYGPEAVRHDTLDEPIRNLWRQGRVRMVSLTDLQKATAEQLNASIPGVNETLFYLERAHA